MIEWLMQPWPWWFSGILVGLTVPLLYFMAGKAFGISTGLQQMGAMCVPRSQWSYFKNFNRRENAWTVVFILGIAGGGYLANYWLSAPPIEFLPEHQQTWSGGLRLLLGGFLVGFGARYAGGCTSGHAITGIANLNWPSLVATIFFFVGGLAVTWGLGAWFFGIPT
jgi:hypothetical protein